MTNKCKANSAAMTGAYAHNAAWGWQDVPQFRPALLLLLLLMGGAQACTTIGVGRLATTDGSVFCSHSNDGEGDTDPRLVRIPSSDWPKGSVRDIYFSPESFPRYVGNARANATYPLPPYAPASGNTNGNGNGNGAPFQPLDGCGIPQVAHTFQYFEETYGALNERQLGIAESTCSGVFGAAPRGMPLHAPEGDSGDAEVGKACFSVDALTQIAMERHSSARAAIQEIGKLAVEGGFYGAGLFEGTAESLIVTDVDEVWVFHILPDPTGASAIWVAQRVPDDSFVVVPNAFIIREIDPNDPNNFMYSDTVFSVATDLGWWDPSSDAPLDFTAMYSDGEYAHKYYSGRRSWGVYNDFAPSLDLPTDYVEWRISRPYPFSARPDRKLSVTDVARVMRSYYEGTPYSTFSGGPWGSPDHVAGNNSTAFPADAPPSSRRPGNWERTIGLYRTSDSYIVQSRKWLPDAAGGVLWYAPYAAPYSIFVPFAAGMAGLPHCTLGTHLALDKSTLFWAFRYLGNYAQIKWTDMMRDDILPFQGALMEDNFGLQRKVDGLIVKASKGDHGAVMAVMELYAENADRIVKMTWELNDHLMFKYADGQLHRTGDLSRGTSASPREYDPEGFTTKGPDIVDQPGYPAEWLEQVGFLDGPEAPPSCEELGWRCGHRLTATGGEADRPSVALRGDSSSAAVMERDTNPGRSLYNDYVRRKEAARRNNSASCGTVGDVAAAVKSCSREPAKVRNNQIAVSLPQ